MSERRIIVEHRCGYSVLWIALIIGGLIGMGLGSIADGIKRLSAEGGPVPCYDYTEGHHGEPCQWSSKETQHD